MTAREKLAMEHPDRVRPNVTGGSIGCPFMYGYLDEPDYCDNITTSKDERCTRCWDREIPEEDAQEKCDAYDDGKCLGTREIDPCSCNGYKANCTFYPAVKEASKKTVVGLDGTTYVQDSDKQGWTGNEPHILDSGDRTEFESGAVRDMRKGKGRCDLLPLDVVSTYLDTALDRIIDGDTHCIFTEFYNFQESGDVNCLYRALDFANPFNNIFTMILEVAKHFEEGALKYGDNNWRKGIPVRCYIDSAIRHYLKFRRGDKDEPHDRAFCWNILCAIWTCEHHPELNEYAKEETHEKDD